MRYAAFLRAINVGTHNRIKMTDLRDVALEAGLGNVVTYLQTGNLLFDSDHAPDTVAGLLESALMGHGLRNAAAIVRGQHELESLLSEAPFEGYPADAFTRFVTLFRSDLPANAAALAGENPAHILVRRREILAVLPIDRPRGVDLNGNLEKRLKVQGTTRYWHVVEEMARMLSAG